MQSFSLHKSIAWALVATGVLWGTSQSLLADVGTAFTWQGGLQDGGTPANGIYDLRFELHADVTGTSQIGSTQIIDDVLVTDGVVLVDLDFGAGAFDGDARWLKVSIKADADVSYTDLSPLTPMLPTPYSMFAQTTGGVIDGGLPATYSGQVAFTNSANSFAGANLAIATGGLVAGSNAVGIGTAAPQNRLHVDSGTDVGLGGGGFVQIGSFTGSNLGIDNNEIMARTNGAASTLYLNNNGGNVAILGSSSTGNVGIGTASPSSRLHLVGPSPNIALKMRSGGSWTAELRQTDSSLLSLVNGGSERMTIAPNGHVGIGTTSPNSRLHVANGTAGVAGHGNSSAVFEKSTNNYVSVLSPDDNERGILFGDPESNVNGGIIYNSGATPDGLQFRTGGNSTRMVISDIGRVGIGTTAPVRDLHVRSTGNAQLWLEADTDNSGEFDQPGITMTQDGAIIQSFMGFIDGSNHFSIQASDTGSGDINLFLNPDGFVGVKTQSPSATLTVRGPDDPDAGPVVRLDSSLGNNAFESGRVRLCEGTVSYLGGYMHYDGAANRLHIGVHNTSDTIPGNDLNSISINRANGRVGIGTANPAQLLDVAGTARVDVLEIEGGADLSERFDVATNGDAIELGMVVCIDPTNPGKLVLSRGAYDPAVAGVISGAGGVSTGMLMGHDGTVADGEHAVALTGRVYVWCDASTGAIKPGDMLTTSDVAGHAMRATDRHRAFGSVIGKAMTGLDDGRGLVLVLVGLQ